MASRESKSDAASSSAVASGKPDAASRIEHATKTLRTVTDHCPTISRAWLGAAGVDGQRSIMVQRSFQDVEANVVRKFVTTHALVEGTGWVNASLFPMQAADTVRMSPSPSGRRLAVIRSSTPKKGGKDKYFLDVLDAGTLLTTVELTSHHDKVVGDNWFGALSWSSDESQVVYVALPKPETRSSFWDTDKKAKNRGTDFDFQEDWGESYVGVQAPKLFVCDWKAGKVAAVKGIAADLSAGQPVFTPDGLGIVFTGWESSPRRLGMVYCYQRECGLYLAAVPTFQDDAENDSDAKADEADEDEKDDGPAAERLTSADQDTVARSPVFSPCGKYLAYLSSFKMLTHNGAGRLCTLTWPSRERRVVLDVVEDPAADEFPGVFCGRLRSRCWTADSSGIYFNTLWRSSIAGVKVDVATGAVAPVPFIDPRTGATCTAAPGTGPCSWVLDHCDRGELILVSAPDVVDTFQMGGALEVNPPPHMPECAELVANVDWQVIDIKPTFTDTSNNSPFQAILLTPKRPAADGRLPPLVTMIHGGPHSNINTSFDAFMFTYLVACGFAVVLPNYRGSTGFGAGPLNSLPGKCGTQDVADVLAATMHVVAMDPPVVDADRLSVCGGSHGGFLSLHMVGQHGDVYKAAAVRNPVANMAHMASITDIPDWCWVEAIAEYDFTKYESPSPELLVKMHAASPIAHVDRVKAPVLLAIGAKDRRCPPSGGMEYYHVLRSRGVTTRMIIFPDCTHSLGTPNASGTSYVNFALWLSEHTDHDLEGAAATSSGTEAGAGAGAQ